MINVFVIDHSLRRTDKVTDKGNGTHNKKKQFTSNFKTFQKWMDTMCLKPNSDKTEYIQFASTKHIENWIAHHLMPMVTS